MDGFSKNPKPDGSHYDLYTDGLRIYTSIDMRMQQYAEEAVNEHLGGVLQPAFEREKRGSRTGPTLPTPTNSVTRSAAPHQNAIKADGALSSYETGRSFRRGRSTKHSTLLPDGHLAYVRERDKRERPQRHSHSARLQISDHDAV